MELSDSEAKRQRVEISKLIQKSVRKEMRKHNNERVASKLEAFRDLKGIAGIRKNGKKHNVCSMTDEHGNLQQTKQGMADVFATLYETLYKSRDAIQEN